MSSGNDSDARGSTGGSGLFLRPSSLIAACFLAVMAISLAYVAGVMSGRSYNARHAGAGEGVADEHSPSALAAAAEKPQVLALEELNFSRALRNEASRAKPAPPVESTAVAAQQPSGGVHAGGPAAPADVPVPEPQPAILRDYVFQVAAFKDEERVDSLRQRLEGRGLRTRMQRSGKLYLVLVMLRGDNDRLTEVKRIFEEMGLNDPITQSVKAVSPDGHDAKPR